MSMLAEPNTESPANVDAAKMWREDKWVSNQKIYIKSRYISSVKTNLCFRAQFKKRACASVRKSLDMAWSLDSNHLHSCLHLHNCAIVNCTLAHQQNLHHWISPIPEQMQKKFSVMTIFSSHYMTRVHFLQHRIIAELERGHHHVSACEEAGQAAHQLWPGKVLSTISRDSIERDNCCRGNE